MVRQEDVGKMGQSAMCGITDPGTDSLSPLLSTPHTSVNSNGFTDEVQASLTTLLSGDESGLSTDDLLGKLRVVINENMTLKETVAQNNLALRNQLSLVVQWRQQQDQQQQQFRHQLQDLTQQLSQSQQENVSLKSQITGTKASSGPANDMSARYLELDDTIRMLNKRLETSERSLRTAQEEKDKLQVQKTRLEGDATLLKCDLTTIRGEQERLQLERFELLSNVNDLRQQLRQAREGAAAQARSHENSPIYYEGMGPPLSEIETQKLRDNLRKEQDTSATLLQELQDTRNQIESLEAEVQRTQEEASLLRHRCNQMQNLNVQNSEAASAMSDGKKGSEIDTLEKKRLKDEAAMLREEVDTLDAALTAERQKTQDERLATTRAHTEINRLKKEMTQLRDETDRNTFNDEYYKQEIRQINEKLDEGTAKLVSYEELLSSKNEEIARLKKELGRTKANLSEMSSEGETIAILRAQVEVYQGDFRAEREAREAIAADREKLRDDVRQLQTRNNQLLDELEAYQRRHHAQGRNSRATSEEPSGLMAGSTGATGGSTAATGGSMGATVAGTSLSQEALWEKLSNSSDKKEEDKKKDEDQLDENLFYCPKCNKSFTQYKPLEEHVNRCLDED